jgi:tRNA A-37 threonylcarbamoyl transferase component Bud32
MAGCLRPYFDVGILCRMTPTKIGRYEIRAELGRGGMATVYRAYDPSFEREVAIKVLPRELLHDPQFHDRFRREIKTIAALEHPAIVPVYDVGEEDGVPYFVMRYMSGGSLSQWIKKGKFSLEDAARIIERISGALAYAHKNGLVHRDLKPDNILFDSNGDPFISDFGVAKLTDSSTNMTGSGIIGTPAYMSPEQAQGDKVDNRSDIYGLGVIIFQMLSGEQPYNATTPMGVAVKHITDPVPEILKVDPTLPPAADKIIKTAMAKNRDERYPTATDLARALNDAAHPAQTTSAPRTSRGASATAGKSNRLGLIIGGVVVLVLALAVVGFLFRNQIFATPPSPTPRTAATVAPVVVPVLPTETAAPAATATQAIQSTAVQSAAPACGPGVVSAVATPVVTEHQRLCNQKQAYTVLEIPMGATYESQRDGFTCTSAQQLGGKQLVSCTGTNLTSFNIKVCSPAPTALATVSGGQCAAGSNFDSANQCCAAAPQADAGCTIYQVNLKGCS